MRPFDATGSLRVTEDLPTHLTLARVNTQLAKAKVNLMNVSVFRVAVCVLGAGVVGCANDQGATAIRSSRTAMAARATTVKSVNIRQNVANLRKQGLSGAQRSRVASLTGTWKWVADLHHQAMQEAINDPTIGGLRGPNDPTKQCSVVTRYAALYHPRSAQASGRRLDENRDAFVKAAIANLGVCKDARQASIFASSTPTFRRSAEVSNRVKQDPERDRTLATYRDYVNALVADLQQAKDLGDAGDLMDHYVAAAADDPEVNPNALKAFAGTIDLARSSAKEWDTYGRGHLASLFIWGWLSDFGNWIVNVVSADVTGCMDTVLFGWGWMMESGYSGSIWDFGQLTVDFCAVGGIIGSIGAAM